MAIAAVAHVYVFSAEPYQFLPISEYGKITTETTKEALKLEEGDKEKSAVLEKTETKVEAPGTSVTESVQDIVVEGGQHVSFVLDNVSLAFDICIIHFTTCESHMTVRSHAREKICIYLMHKIMIAAYEHSICYYMYTDTL
jgi:hypothetical protein